MPAILLSEPSCHPASSPSKVEGPIRVQDGSGVGMFAIQGGASMKKLDPAITDYYDQEVVKMIAEKYGYSPITDTIDHWGTMGYIKKNKLCRAKNGRVLIERKSIDAFYRQCGCTPPA